MHLIKYIGNGNIDAKVQLPSSKSISNRLLVLNYLSGYLLQIENLSEARDTKILNELLAHTELPETIDCQDAGTVFRFMLAVCAIQEGQSFKLSGTKRLLQRPHDTLINALIELGADIHWAPSKEYLIIKGKKLHGKKLLLAGDISSQFVSALCLIAPKIVGGLHLEIIPPLLSKPYIKMTLNLMKQVGIAYRWELNTIFIQEQNFLKSQQHFVVENDWSSACFFYAMAILSKEATIKIQNLSLNSIQGDAAIAQFSSVFGVESIEKENDLLLIKKKSLQPTKAQHFSLGGYPDLAIPLITACAIQHPKTTFSGLEHLRHKESDRINSLKVELEKVGIFLKEVNGHITFTRSETRLLDKIIPFSSHNDHRMAMSLSLLSLHFGQISLDNIACVGKSFPAFFEQIRPLGFR